MNRLFEVVAIQKCFQTAMVEASDPVFALQLSWITDFEDAELLDWRVVEIDEVGTGVAHAVDAHGVVDGAARHICARECMCGRYGRCGSRRWRHDDGGTA